MIAHCKLNDILNFDSKHRLLEGVEQVPEKEGEFAVVYEVKRRLQIHYNVSSITGLDKNSTENSLCLIKLAFGNRTAMKGCKGILYIKSVIIGILIE